VGGSPLSSTQPVGVKMRGVGVLPRLRSPLLLLSSLEVGESSRGDFFKGLVVLPGPR
jgi:hypothetical protein